jgi:hypothetical protein
LSRQSYALPGAPGVPAARELDVAIDSSEAEKPLR